LQVCKKISEIGARLRSFFAGRGVLNKDPTICLDGARPANTSILYSFLVPAQLNIVPPPKLTTLLVGRLSFFLLPNLLKVKNVVGHYLAMENWRKTQDREEVSPVQSMFIKPVSAFLGQVKSMALLSANVNILSVSAA
jgi:hypothetical protein